MNKITFEIEGKEYELPTFLSIGDYVKIYKVKNIFDEEYYGAKMISLLTGCPVQDLIQVNYNKMNYLVNYVITLFPRDKNNFIDRFELDGVKYGFIDSWKKMTYGEYVDLDTLFRRDDTLEYIHIIMAILYRPIISEDKKTKKYEIEKYDSDVMVKRAEIFKEKLDIKYFHGAQFFFTLFAMKYQLHTQQYLKNLNLSTWGKIKWIWKNRKLVNQILLYRKTDGTLSPIDLVRMTLQNTIKSTKKPWWKSLIRFRSFKRKINGLKINKKE